MLDRNYSFFFFFFLFLPVGADITSLRSVVDRGADEASEVAQFQSAQMCSILCSNIGLCCSFTPEKSSFNKPSCGMGCVLGFKLSQSAIGGSSGSSGRSSGGGSGGTTTTMEAGVIESSLLCKNECVDMGDDKCAHRNAFGSFNMCSECAVDEFEVLADDQEVKQEQEGVKDGVSKTAVCTVPPSVLQCQHGCYMQVCVCVSVSVCVCVCE